MIELQESIKGFSRNDISSSSPSVTDGFLASSSDYHFDLDEVSIDGSPSATTYLGPGNSAAVVKRLLTEIGSKHITSNSKTSEEAVAQFLSVAASEHDRKDSPSFPLYDDHRDLDLPAMIPPTTQNCLIEHYLTVVQPIFPLLSQRRQKSIIRHENPLQWSMENFGRPDANIIIAVLAISTSLVARDIDAKLLNVSDLTRSLLQRLEHGFVLADEMSIEASKQKITILCFQAIYEFVNPTSGQVWDIVGRALASLEQLRLNYHSGSTSLDDDYRRLELSFLILER